MSTSLFMQHRNEGCLIVFLRNSISCLQERSDQLITLQIQGYFIHLNLEGSIHRTKDLMIHSNDDPHNMSHLIQITLEVYMLYPLNVRVTV